MIVRTYKRRNRGEFLGFQGSSASSLLSVEDDEISHLSSKSAIAGAFSQDVDVGGGNGGVPNSVLGRNSSGQGQVRYSFSLLSSRSDSSLPSSSDPVSGIQQEARSISEPEDFSHKRKCSSVSSAGQKLIRAESLLIKSKANSGTSAIPGKSRSKSSKGNGAETGRGSSEDQVTGENQILSRVRNSAMAGSTATGSSIVASVAGLCAPPTSTLLEAQESGEMMEHMDEVTFAMDGLSPGKPLRTRRASLISFLSIFGTRQRRRLLRTHGIMKHVLDVVLTVPTDDSSTALAAAALLYVTACDGQDEDFLDSPACIDFLMRLLRPICPAREEKCSLLGSRLLALGSNLKSNKLEVSSTSLEQGGVILVDKVKGLLSTTKGWKDGQNPEAALSCTWLVLLTFEKACLSTVVLEDNAGSVRKVGGHFKERLRELGGLDTLCDLAASCFDSLKKVATMNIKEDQQNQLMKGSTGVGVLLRCLKVMENVTFLSENNQKHLLDKIMPKTTPNSPNTFIGVIIATINVISDIILARSHQQEVKANDTDVRKLQGCRSIGDISLRALGKASINKKRESALQRHKSKQNFEFDEFDCDTDKDTVKSQVSRREKGQTAVKTAVNNGVNNYDDMLDECLLSAVKVLMNLTNDNDLGCRQVAAVGGLDAVALLIAKHFPAFQVKVPLETEEKQNAACNSQETDLLVVILGVLVNLVEKNLTNRDRLASLSTKDSSHDSDDKAVENGIIALLCSIFLSKEGSANMAESNGGDSMPKIDAECNITQEQKEAEDMIVEAYSALLLAFLSKESLMVRNSIAQHLPNNNLSALVPVLERFLEFHLSLNMLSRETHETVREVIDSCK